MVSASEIKRSHSRRRGGSAARITAVLFLLSHVLILVFFTNPLFCLLFSLLSLFFSLLVAYQMYLLEIALNRVARGLVVHASTLRRHWPLTHLFVLVEKILQQAGQQEKNEQRTVAYRDQLLQQVSKTAAQEERNRLARDLHDSIKQQIFSITVSAAAVRARWEHNLASARKIIDDIERTALEAQIEMQALLQQLRPVALENVGLIESLRMQCQALGYRTGAQVETELDELPSEEELPLGTQETIFRIVQEGFANIARHARASRVWLSLYRQRDALLVEIGDNGQGFDVSRQVERPNKDGGMGLGNVRERVAALGGTVAIWSRPDEGTTLHLCIPLAKPAYEIESEEQERNDRERASTVRKTRRTLSIGMRISELGIALILLYAPTLVMQPALLACGIGALVAWLWAQQYRLQVSFDLGPEHSVSYQLRAQSYELLSTIILLGMMSPLSVWSIYIALRNNGWVAIGYLGIGLSAIISAFALYVRHNTRYHTNRPYEEQQKQIRQVLRQTIVDWIAWVGATVIVIAILLRSFSLPTEYFYSYNTIDTETRIMAMATLIAWFIANIVKWLSVVYWQRRITRETAISNANTIS